MIGEDSLSYTTQTYDELKSFLELNNITKIIDCCSSPSVVCLNVEKSQPLFYLSKERKVFFPSSYKNIASIITSMAISPCENYALTAHEDGTIILWDIKKQSALASINIEDKSKIVSAVFLGSYETFIVAQENGMIRKYEASTISLFLFLKEKESFNTQVPIKKIICCNSIDKSIIFLAVLHKYKVSIYDLIFSFKNIANIEISGNSDISFINNEWHFNLAIQDGQNVTIYRVNDSSLSNKKCFFEFPEEIIYIGFISPILLAVVTKSEITLCNIFEEVCSVYNDLPFNSDKICSTTHSISLIPYGSIEIQDFEGCIKHLLEQGNFSNAAELAVSIYCGDSSYFSCSQRTDALKQQLRNAILLLVHSPTFSNSQYPFVADCITRGDILDLTLDDTLKHLSNPESKLEFCISLLKCDEVRPEVTSRVIDELDKLQSFCNKDVEDALLMSPLSASFLQKAIAVGIKLRYSRFVLHTFDRFFDDILPPFAQIIESGDKEIISQTCKYVFLSKSFSDSKTNTCIIWLHAPGKNRLQTVFKSDWSISCQIAENFLKRCPIKFSMTQNLTSVDMVRTMFLCFEDAEPPYADDLFTLIATKSIQESIPVPALSVPTILKYIFNSKAPRDIREGLFLRIIDIDYHPHIDISQFKYHAARSGFSCVVQRLAHGDSELELRAESCLLSDNPEDALQLFEQYDGDRNTARSTITKFFRPLLYLNPRRLIKLIFSKFKSLHPQKVLEIAQPCDAKLYFDTLFSIDDPPIVSQQDTSTYIHYLSLKRDTHHIIKFLRNSPNISRLTANETCLHNQLHIGCAVLASMTGQYQNAFKSYKEHINMGGQADLDLTNTILEHMSYIEDPAPVVVKTLLEPLVNNIDEFKMEVEKALKSEKVTRTDVLIALFSLRNIAKNEKTEKYIEEYLNSGDACKLKVPDAEADVKMCMPAYYTLAISGTNPMSMSDGTVIVKDYGIGIITVTTEKEEGELFADMPEQISEQVRNVLQHAEIQLLINNKKKKQDEPVTIIMEKKK
ncbi:hypothetical protein TVAG_482510 [Trichomonas vaginalis G3]|uniref:Uncharacterized protein n=1 Tax=Trichomonas vaginalis (strain ATCC PRA-98 / G3) TaxID=412133 RepID=A2G4U5_TRIV3|nr:VPS8 subunit of corvet complex family [Trichomonas vaginalis G3]EAX87826.1 hypothetical protein TVAG_482510 [Trichomonas vaginalis G3]KAI5535550.1 VPS8 subunit of corvet complex family [Trichomonas vaginalis G3]|eukprot:XP_001300756.1 hypothetical protein [Trichomonas vaginalis G3]